MFFLKSVKIGENKVFKSDFCLEDFLLVIDFVVIEFIIVVLVVNFCFLRRLDVIIVFFLFLLFELDCLCFVELFFLLFFDGDYRKVLIEFNRFFFGEIVEFLLYLRFVVLLFLIEVVLFMFW